MGRSLAIFGLDGEQSVSTKASSSKRNNTSHRKERNGLAGILCWGLRRGCSAPRRRMRQSESLQQ
eukprot:scaffold1809_cov386-Prasinococcus_capsulatus_cf.AAC.4